MSKLLTIVGATIGGAIGWWLGAHVGTMTAFFVSMVGTGAGIYAGRSVAASILG
jgi:membrane protein YqaA with SNARE-associated domain